MRTATYSPDDNKLRLYSSSRLDAETFAAVKAAGFRWAAKQDLFVAPMWTPEREDLLVDLCGQIDDEDKSLVERQEERAERFEGYSERRLNDACQAKAAVSAMVDKIPIGQPILVGHHSAQRARRDAERIENGMRRAVKMWETSTYWTRRASGALHHAKYREEPAVRARRIKKIEADKRRQERQKSEAQGLIRFWLGESKATNRKTGESRVVEIQEENRDFLCRVLGGMASSGAGFPGRDGNHHFSAWEVLKPEGERYANCPEKTVAEVQDCVLRFQENVVARCDRWIAHYRNRIAYEQAMLAESGGTVTDQTGPEKGGACRCWASRGGWLIIQRVNQVSVSLLDNWGDGGKDFKRKIPYDKVTALMSKAEVDAARAAGRLLNETPRGFILMASTPPEPPKPDASC